MLFLYRPRQTWIPYPLPRQQTEQAAYNRQLQERFDATRRVPSPTPGGAKGPPAPAPGVAGAWQGQDLTTRLKELAQLHADGALSDAEFSASKAKVLGTTPAGP
jgi:hypothetical protein